MQFRVQANDLSIRQTTRSLMSRMLGPLCGLSQRVSFMNRSDRDPRFMTAGGELTGVHILRGQPPPNVNTYHIGGGGVLLDEPLIRALGESVERYSQLISEVAAGEDELRFASYAQMQADGERTLSPESMRLFTDEQYDAPGMPFERFDPEAPMSWIAARSLVGNAPLWVPAQLVLVGYVPKRDRGEPWLLSAVTTGSAAHTDPSRALRSSLLELIQIDAVMGHWYSEAAAERVVLDERTRAISRLIDRHFPGTMRPEFYWIPSADLPGMIIACVIRDELNFPALSVGLGCDMRLGQALYKSLLEAVSVVQLAKITILYQSPEERERSTTGGPILDFDNNVALYAARGEHPIVAKKFRRDQRVAARDLPADSTGSPAQENAALVAGFRATGKELIFLDLTTDDIASLGFCAARVWSPDTIGLSLPTVPPAAHPRYASYGGASHARPHPYP